MRYQTMTSNFEGIQELFLRMLADGERIFGATADALLGWQDPGVIREDVFSTDKRINEAEQQLRRLILVHATVQGVQAFPAMLAMMSIAKDAERIGDYGKNLFDLSMVRPPLSAEGTTISSLRQQIAGLLRRARELHGTQDRHTALEFLDEASKAEDTCDARIEALLQAEGTNHAGAALAYRYFKRVVSHASNIVTALVVPLDKLDFSHKK